MNVISKITVWVHLYLESPVTVASVSWLKTPLWRHSKRSTKRLLKSTLRDRYKKNVMSISLGLQLHLSLENEPDMRRVKLPTAGCSQKLRHNARREAHQATHDSSEGAARYCNWDERECADNSRGLDCSTVKLLQENNKERKLTLNLG